MYTFTIRIKFKNVFTCTLLGFSSKNNYYLTVECRIGWHDIALFEIFNNGHIAADQVFVMKICRNLLFTSRNSKQKWCLNFLGPKMGKFVFDLVK